MIQSTYYLLKVQKAIQQNIYEYLKISIPQKFFQQQCKFSGKSSFDFSNENIKIYIPRGVSHAHYRLQKVSVVWRAKFGGFQDFSGILGDFQRFLGIFKG